MMRATSFILLCLSAWGQPDPLAAGMEAYVKGDYPVAERMLRASSAPQAKAFLALTLAATNRCEEAVPELKQAFEGQGSIQRLVGLALAQCNLSASRFDDAGSVIAQLKAKYPSDADVLYL